MNDIVVNNKYSLFLKEIEFFTKKTLSDDKKEREMSKGKFTEGFLGLFKRSNMLGVNENYISLDTFLSMLLKYYKNIMVEKDKLKRAFGNSNKNIIFGSSRIYISHYAGFVDIKDGYPILISKAYEKEYLKFKKYIYRFAKTMNSYENFKEAVSNDFLISEITTLNIKADQILSEGIVAIEIKIGDLAVISISIIDGKVDIATHSNVGEIDIYLLKNNKNLLKKIFINKETLQEILRIFKEYEEILGYL